MTQYSRFCVGRHRVFYDVSEKDRTAYVRAVREKIIE